MKTTATSEINFYVLGQNGSSGEIIRCTDTGAAEFELAQMHLSSCQRIARTTRRCTEAEAMEFFRGEMTALHRRDSGFNVRETSDGDSDDSDDETSVDWKPSHETMRLARATGVRF